MIRSDLETPVFQFVAETDVLRGFVAARQADTDKLVTWEVAGTAHADQSTLDWGTASAQQWYDGPPVDFTTMCGPLSSGPQAEVLRAALDALRRWVSDGTRPATSPLLEVADGSFVVDELGIARGGMRTPAVDVPVAVQSGQPREGSSVFCSLFGHRDDFSSEQRASLYPTHEDYVSQVRN